MSGVGEGNELHLVMFPWFAFGHISPFVQLSNKLSSSYGVKISFFTASATVRRVQSMLAPTPTTQIVPLTLPHVDGLPVGVENTADTSADGAELLKVALDLMKPQIKALLTDLKPHIVLFDFAQCWLPEMASELGIKTILFSVFSAISVAFLAVPARLTHDHDTPTPPTVEEIKKPPRGFPGVIPVKNFQTPDFLYVFKSFYGTPSAFDRMNKGVEGCDAMLFKSCREMEEAYIDYVSTQFRRPTLLAGLLVPKPNTGKLEERWANWLDQFPPKSVIYSSFGTETFLTDGQIRELALGLELTGLPFFLVLNFPANLDSSTELKRTLPQGFLERVKDKGVVHSGWVQQQQILAHENVGCYVCHAGFGPMVEGLVNDCQLVMLPLKVDQFVNSNLAGIDWKAGVEVNRRDEDGYFGEADVCEAVKSIMMDCDKEPAKSIRETNKKWKEFLQNDEIQDKYITDLVENMKVLARA